MGTIVKNENGVIGIALGLVFLGVGALASIGCGNLDVAPVNYTFPLEMKIQEGSDGFNSEEVEGIKRVMEAWNRGIGEEVFHYGGAARYSRINSHECGIYKEYTGELHGNHAGLQVGGIACSFFLNYANDRSFERNMRAAAHEMGHMLGLGHNNSSHISIMVTRKKPKPEVIINGKYHIPPYDVNNALRLLRDQGYNFKRPSDLDAIVEIRTIMDFKKLEENPLGKYSLMNDLDLSGINWEPIKNFRGVFDGKGYTIKNLSIDKSGNSNIGFFGSAVGATIKNLRLLNARIVGGDYTGVLLGNGKAVKLLGIKVEGAEVSGDGDFHGGLVGSTEAGSAIQNSYATGEVSGSGNRYGGLVGYMRAGSAIQNSYATGEVSGNGYSYGGLVGLMQGEGNVIQNSYATGEVSGDGYYHGGLVGYMREDAAIQNSYATGEVSGIGNNHGGLVGYMWEDAAIQNSYATGEVSGSGSYHGGLVGSMGGDSVIQNSYATGEVSGSGSYHGGLVGLMEEGSVIQNSFVTGEVPGSGYFQRGLVGGLLKSAGNDNVIQNGHALTVAELESYSNEETRWDIGFGTGQERLMSLYCDTNNDREISDDERLPIWDFRTDTELPIIRCITF